VLLRILFITIVSQFPSLDDGIHFHKDGMNALTPQSKQQIYPQKSNFAKKTFPAVEQLL
jgi:hypothetical protein